MSIAVEAEMARRRGATTEHPPKWGCEEGATTSPGHFCFNPFGLRIFLFEASSIVGHRSMADMLPPRLNQKSLSAAMLIVFQQPARTEMTTSSCALLTQALLGLHRSGPLRSRFDA